MSKTNAESTDGVARKWLGLALVTLLLVLGDQASKHWAHTTLRTGYNGRVELIDGLLRLTYARNPGAAWGLFAHRSAAFRKPFFVAATLLALAFIFYLFQRTSPKQRVLALALSCVLGGAIGNFIDRLRFNYVIDFIDVHLGTRFTWPTFNVADIAISCGVLLMLLDMVRGGRHPQLDASEQQPNH